MGVFLWEDVIFFGVIGGIGCVSGWVCDVCKCYFYVMYGKVDFKEIVYIEGDCFVCYMVCMEEILESMDIIE